MLVFCNLSDEDCVIVKSELGRHAVYFTEATDQNFSFHSTLPYDLLA